MLLPTVREQGPPKLLLNYAWWMKKKYAESTIRDRGKLLRMLVKRGRFTQPRISERGHRSAKIGRGM